MVRHLVEKTEIAEVVEKSFSLPVLFSFCFSALPVILVMREDSHSHTGPSDDSHVRQLKVHIVNKPPV